MWKKQQTERRIEIDGRKRRIVNGKKYTSIQRERNILINWIDYDVVVANFISFVRMKLNVVWSWLFESEKAAKFISSSSSSSRWYIGIAAKAATTSTTVAVADWSIRVFYPIWTRAGMNVVWIDLLGSTCLYHTFYMRMCTTHKYNVLCDPKMFTFHSHSKSLLCYVMFGFDSHIEQRSRGSDEENRKILREQRRRRRRWQWRWKQG